MMALSLNLKLKPKNRCDDSGNNCIIDCCWWPAPIVHQQPSLVCAYQSEKQRSFEMKEVLFSAASFVLFGKFSDPGLWSTFFISKFSQLLAFSIKNDDGWKSFDFIFFREFFVLGF